jgi:hypothetical protein
MIFVIKLILLLPDLLVRIALYPVKAYGYLRERYGWKKEIPKEIEQAIESIDDDLEDVV